MYSCGVIIIGVTYGLFFSIIITIGLSTIFRSLMYEKKTLKLFLLAYKLQIRHHNSSMAS